MKEVLVGIVNAVENNTKDDKLTCDSLIYTFIIVFYAAGFSAYNSIEHLWAPISRRLSGAKANPCAEGDDVPPIIYGNNR